MAIHGRTRTGVVGASLSFLLMGSLKPYEVSEKGYSFAFLDKEFRDSERNEETRRHPSPAFALLMRPLPGKERCGRSRYHTPGIRQADSP